MTINFPRIDKSFYCLEPHSSAPKTTEERVEAIIAALPVLPEDSRITPFMIEVRRCLEQAKEQPHLLEKALIPLLNNLLAETLVPFPESSYHLDRVKAPGVERSQIDPDDQYGHNLRSFNPRALTRPGDRNFREMALAPLTWEEAAAIVANCRYLQQPYFWEAVTGDLYAVASALDAAVETELEQRKEALTPKEAAYASPIHDTADLRAILLPLEVAKAVVCADGSINRGLVHKVKKIFLSEKPLRDGVEQAIAQGLDQLNHDDALVRQIEGMILPPGPTHAEAMATIALVDHEGAFNHRDARVAVLASCLTWIRQYDLQDCFARSTLTTIVWTSLRRLVSNMQQILTLGGLTTTMEDGHDLVVAPLWMLCPNAGNKPCLTTDLTKLAASPFVLKACSLLGISDDRFRQAAMDLSCDNFFTVVDVLLHEAADNPLLYRALAILEAPTQNTLVHLVENSFLSIRTLGRECYRRFAGCMADILTSKGIGDAEAPRLIHLHLHLGYLPMLPLGQEGLWYFSLRRTTLILNEKALLDALNELLGDQNKTTTVTTDDLAVIRAEPFFADYLAGYDANATDVGEMQKLFFKDSTADPISDDICLLTGPFLVSKSNDIALQVGGNRPWVHIPISCGCHYYCFQPHRVIEFARGRSPDEVSESLMAASGTLLKTPVHQIPDFSQFFDFILGNLVTHHNSSEQIAFVRDLKHGMRAEETVETVISKIVDHFPDGFCSEEPTYSLTPIVESPQERDKSRLFALVLGLARPAFPSVQALLPFGDSNFKMRLKENRQAESIVYSFFDPQTDHWRVAFSLSNEILQMLDYAEIVTEPSQFPPLWEDILRRRRLELQWKASKPMWKQPALRDWAKITATI